MKIITGTAKGINIETLEGNATRPTSQRVKEAIFSMIQFDIEGKTILDKWCVVLHRKLCIKYVGR